MEHELNNEEQLMAKRLKRAGDHLNPRKDFVRGLIMGLPQRKPLVSPYSFRWFMPASGAIAVAVALLVLNQSTPLPVTPDFATDDTGSDEVSLMMTGPRSDALSSVDTGVVQPEERVALKAPTNESQTLMMSGAPASGQSDIDIIIDAMIRDGFREDQALAAEAHDDTITSDEASLDSFTTTYDETQF